MGFSRPNVVVGVCADGVMGGGLGSVVEIGVTCDVGAVLAEEAAVLSAVEAVSYVAMVALERTTESGRTTCCW